MLQEFIEQFLKHLAALDGENSSLLVFCRVDMSVYIDEEKRVSFYINEVERGITTCLWVGSGASAAGHVGSDIAWPLACWIAEEAFRLQLSSDPLD